MQVFINIVLGRKLDKYLLDNINLDNYDIDKGKSDLENLKEICLQECTYKSKDKEKAINDWLRGLPSSLTIAFCAREVYDLQEGWYTETKPILNNAYCFESYRDMLSLDDYYTMLSKRLIKLFKINP